MNTMVDIIMILIGWHSTMDMLWMHVAHEVVTVVVAMGLEILMAPTTTSDKVDLATYRQTSFVIGAMGLGITSGTVLQTVTPSIILVNRKVSLKTTNGGFLSGVNSSSRTALESTRVS